MKNTTYNSKFITGLQIVSLVADIYAIYCLVDSLKLDNKGIRIATILVLTTILVLLIVFWRKIHSALLTTILNIFSSNNPREILDKVVEYEYINRNELRFSCEFLLRARYDKLEDYTDRLLWTGGVIENITAKEPNHQIEFINKPNINQISLARQTYRISFPTSISCHDSEPLKVGVLVDSLKDPEGIALPQLVVGIYDITKHLTLRVYFPGNIRVDKIKKQSYAHFVDENPYMVETGKCIFDDASSRKYVEMYIKRPIYGGKYAIQWEFRE